jgi:uncharacterized protein YbjT (DUF2867 family)
MKVAIFGATGGTGRIIIRRALERGYEVTAAARNPSALLGGHERLRVVKADVLQPQTLEAVVDDQDAVITSVSVGNAVKERRKPTTLFSEGTRNVILIQRGRAGPSARDHLRQDHEAAHFERDVRGYEPYGARGEKQRPRLDHRAPLNSDR